MSKAENQKTFIKSMIDFDKRHAFEKFDFASLNEFCEADYVEGVKNKFS